MANHSGVAPIVWRLMKAAVLTTVAAAALVQTTSAQFQDARAAAERAAERGRPEDALKSSDTDTRPYDKRDFEGIWSRNPTTYGLPRCPECGDPGPWIGYGFHGTPPPRTPEGLKVFEANIPGRGIEKDSEEAKRRTDLDIAYRRAVLPAFGNDPEGRCEPLGLPRLITFSGGGPVVEMIHTRANDRIIQRFEWTFDHREIWLDGRKPADPDAYAPRPNGYSVGRWEGDTLVVTTNGFDDRIWLDQMGFPVSDQATLEERWERPSPNRLRVQMTLNDPKYYTAPWKSSYKVWGLVPKEKTAIGGWAGLLEERCIPSDEALFNTFRDHAAGLKK